MKKKVIEHIKNFKGKVFVDIGAHIGKYSLIVAKRNPKAKIISIEANPETFKILKKNIKLNNLKNIIPLNLAAYSKTTELHFYDIKFFSGLSSIYDITKGKKVKIMIKARKLDDILKKLKIKNVDMMKLDVEGSEPEVFKGATKILKNKNLIIFFEAWNEYYLKKCEKILKKFGYDIKPVAEIMYMASRK